LPWFYTSEHFFSKVCGGRQIEGAVEQVRGLETELQDMGRAALEGALAPLPGESVSTSC